MPIQLFPDNIKILDSTKKVFIRKIIIHLKYICSNSKSTLAPFFIDSSKYGIKDGKNILNEILIQKCIYDYAYNNEKTELYWEYMINFYKECLLTESFNPICKSTVSTNLYKFHPLITPNHVINLKLPCYLPIEVYLQLVFQLYFLELIELFHFFLEFLL